MFIKVGWWKERDVTYSFFDVTLWANIYKSKDRTRLNLNNFYYIFDVRMKMVFKSFIHIL